MVITDSHLVERQKPPDDDRTLKSWAWSKRTPQYTSWNELNHYHFQHVPTIESSDSVNNNHTVHILCSTSSNATSELAPSRKLYCKCITVMYQYIFIHFPFHVWINTLTVSEHATGICVPCRGSGSGNQLLLAQRFRIETKVLTTWQINVKKYDKSLCVFDMISRTQFQWFPPNQILYNKIPQWLIWTPQTILARPSS